MKNVNTLWCASLFLLTVSLMAADYRMTGKLDRNPAVYMVGETITLTLQLLDGTNPAVGKQVKYRIGSQPEKTVETGKEPLKLSGSMSHPGKLSFSAVAFDSDGKTVLKNAKGRPIHYGTGAMADPLKLKTSRKEPADFDAFWQAQIARLKTVPMTVKKEEVASRDKRFRTYNVEIAALSKTPASGYLSIPVNAKPGSLPILFQTSGAGTKSAYKLMRTNMIVFHLNPHGCKNGQNKEYYDKFFSTIAKNYPHQGKTSRETSYFHGQTMRLLRALDYVKTLPEWNKKDLIISGTSIGGSQAIVGAALDPQVTVCIANDPALCDHAGRLDKPARRSGWPQLLNNDPKVLAASDYYDNIFFASRIKCDAYFATGFCDNTCNSEGVYIAFNNVRGKKIMTTNPTAGHCGTSNVPGNKRITEIQKSVK